MLERVAVLEDRSNSDRAELGAVRAKVHELAGTGAAVAQLSRELERLRGELPAIAEAAATRALEAREELERAAGNYRRGGMALGLQGLGLLAAGAGTTAGIIFGVHAVGG